MMDDTEKCPICETEARTTHPDAVYYHCGSVFATDSGKMWTQGDECVRTESKRLRRAKSIIDERDRQDAKWGPQDHDLATWLVILMEEVGELAAAILCHRFGNDDHPELDWRKEAIQVAAVALSIVEQVAEPDGEAARKDCVLAKDKRLRAIVETLVEKCHEDIFIKSPRGQVAENDTVHWDRCLWLLELTDQARDVLGKDDE